LSSSNSFNKVLKGCNLAPSSHCRILIYTPLAGKVGWENYLSIAPKGNLAPSSHCRILNDNALAVNAGWENDLSIAPRADAGIILDMILGESDDTRQYIKNSLTLTVNLTYSTSTKV
jgi:hypothetical protein